MNNQFKPTHSGTPPEPPKDTRVQMTKVIWGWSTAMLGICIPLTQNASNPWLPLCVLGAAAVGTVAVWLSKDGSSHGQTNNQLEATQEQLRQIEERLANVETISRFERALHERESLGGLGDTLSPSSEKERPTPRSSTPLSQ